VISGSVKISQNRILPIATVAVKRASRFILIPGGSFNIDTAPEPSSNQPLGPGQEPPPNPQTPIVLMNGDPVKIIAGPGAGDGTETGVTDDFSGKLREEKMVTAPDSFLKPFLHQFNGNLHFFLGKEPRGQDNVTDAPAIGRCDFLPIDHPMGSDGVSYQFRLPRKGSTEPGNMGTESRMILSMIRLKLKPARSAAAT